MWRGGINDDRGGGRGSGSNNARVFFQWGVRLWWQVLMLLMVLMFSRWYCLYLRLFHHFQGSYQLHKDCVMMQIIFHCWQFIILHSWTDIE